MSSFVFEVGKRFRQPSQQDSYISFVSSASTIGIGLGCTVLILLLSVMNGFEYELRHSLLKVVPHAEIFAIDSQGLNPEPEFTQKIEKDYRVARVYEINKATGLLQVGKKMKAVSLVGVTSEYFVDKFEQKNQTHRQTGQTNDDIVIQQGAVENEKLDKTSEQLAYEVLRKQVDGILLGKTIMQEQDITIGDKIQVLLPSNTQDLSFAAPKSAWLTVIGEISVGGELDNQLGIVNKQYLADLLGFREQYTHIEIKLHDPFDAYELVREYGYRFSQAAYMSDWTRTNGHLYQDIQLIRTVIYIVLALVIAVACFNIVSALVMSVKEKSKEIAILKTIGATNSNIAFIFVYKGLYHGLKGAFFGTVIGVLLAANLTQIIEFFEFILGESVLTTDIYFTAGIPSKLDWIDVISTSVLVIIISAMATLYPAKQAANIEPTENLH